MSSRVINANEQQKILFEHIKMNRMTAHYVERVDYLYGKYEFVRKQKCLTWSVLLLQFLQLNFFSSGSLRARESIQKNCLANCLSEIFMILCELIHWTCRARQNG